MIEASKTCSRETSKGTHSATSSPGLEDGVTHSGLQDGRMTDPSGLGVVHARVSARQVKDLGLQTLVTSGRRGSGSSVSAVLQSSLESRLQQRLDMAGSTLFQETWKRKATPLGRAYLAHTVSARRTSGSACISVPTPNTPSGGPNTKSTAAHTGGMDLEGAASLSAVPTPNAMEGGQTSRSVKCKGELLMGGIVHLASVPTCRAPDGEHGGPNMRSSAGNLALPGTAALVSVATPNCCDATRRSAETAEDKKRRGAHPGMSLLDHAALATVTTSASRDWKDTPGMAARAANPDGLIRTRLDQLPRQVQLAASGETVTGGMDGTVSIGQLNPGYSRWLMGYPIEWDDCGVMVTPSSPSSRRNSSKRT